MASVAPASTGYDNTPLERVEKLRDVIARGGDEAQQLRRLPDYTDATLEIDKHAMPRALESLC